MSNRPKNSSKHSPNKTIKTEQDIMNSCRVCLSKDVEMTNIFDDDNNIIDKILFCTGIQVITTTSSALVGTF